MFVLFVYSILNTHVSSQGALRGWVHEAKSFSGVLSVSKQESRSAYTHTILEGQRLLLLTPELEL